MLMGFHYRNAGLTRATPERAPHAPAWVIDKERMEPVSFNQVIDMVDARHTELPPYRLTCKKCGVYELLDYCQKTKAELIANQFCFHCSFWHEKAEVEKAQSNRVVRVAGFHYWIGDEYDGPAFTKGYGGRKFRIQFNDGRLVETTNLWSQGCIPNHFRDLLPDNAVFLEKP